MSKKRLAVLVLLLSLSLSLTDAAFATHENDGDHTTIGTWIDHEITYADETVFVIDNFPVIINNPHVTEIILDWDNPGLPEGEIFLDSVVDGTLGMQIPKNMPRTMNLDFGSSLSTSHYHKMIVELESECFYILEIPLGTDHVIFGSGSVTAGRWEPVIKDNDSCHDVYRDLLISKSRENFFAEETLSEYHVGTIQWLKANYPSSGTAVVRVIDPDMNLNHEKIDNFDVFVQSDSHTKGLNLTMTETDVSTGVFEGTLFLTLSYEAMGHRLKVAEGDTITAEYVDNTLPAPYTKDSLNIIAKSEIHPTLESPLKQFKSGIPADETQCKKNLILVTRHGGTPACITPATQAKLIDRSWIYRELKGSIIGNTQLTDVPETKHQKENIVDDDYPPVSLPMPTYASITNDIQKIGYDICDIQIDNGTIVLHLNWIFEGSPQLEKILSKIPSDVGYEIVYHEGYTDYFINTITGHECNSLNNTDMTLHATQQWGYIKDISMLNNNYIGVAMSYPTNDAYHELYPDESASIIGNCDVQNDSANLSILHLNDIDYDANTITFTKENKIFAGMSCDDAFWDEMTRHGYCGPSSHLTLQRETLMSSLADAQNMVDFTLVVPKYLPAGYDVQKIMIDGEKNHVTMFISPMPVTNETDMCKFTWSDGGIYLSYVSIPEDTPRFSNDPDKERITINDNRGYVKHQEIGDRAGTPIPQGSEITWHIPKDNLVLNMYSSISSEELIKIAESIG